MRCVARYPFPYRNVVTKRNGVITPCPLGSSCCLLPRPPTSNIETEPQKRHSQISWSRSTNRYFSHESVGASWIRPAQYSQQRIGHPLMENMQDSSQLLINEIPVGSFTKSNFRTMERCLRFWAEYFTVLHSKKYTVHHTGSDGQMNKAQVQNIVSQLWLRIQKERQNRNTEVPGRVYAHVVDVFAKAGEARKAEEVLKEMVDQVLLQQQQQCTAPTSMSRKKSSTQNQNPKADFNQLHAALFSSVIHAYAKKEHALNSSIKYQHRHDDAMQKDGVDRAEALLRYQLQLYQDMNQPMSIKPNVICFTTLLDAYARRGDARKAERLLSEMMNYGLNPTTTSFNVVLAAWARASALETIHTSNSALTYKNQHTVECAHTNDTGVSPNMDTKANATLIMEHTVAAAHAERILLTMAQQSQGYAQPDVVSYSSVIKAWADSKVQPYGLKRAEDILRSMEGNAQVHSNITCYNTLINAYANLGDADSTERLLFELINHYEKKLHSSPDDCMRLKPDNFTFNTVLKALTRYNVKGIDEKEDEGGPREHTGYRAEKILNLMESWEEKGMLKVDVISYNTVLKTWSNMRQSPLALDQAVRLLSKMEQKQICDIISYNTIMSAYANHVEEIMRSKEIISLASNSYQYDRRRYIVDLCEKAESILSKMESVRNCVPDQVSYNTMMKVWAKCGEIERAESILRRMQASDSSASPSPMTYVTLIDAYAYNSRIHDVSSKMDIILLEMKDRFRSVPAVAYNAVINVLSKTKRLSAVLKAENILNQMEREENGLPNPDLLTYCSVINAWSQCKSHEKAIKAQNVLMRLHAYVLDKPKLLKDPRNKDIMINAHNICLMACAFTTADSVWKETLDVVHDVLATMRSSPTFSPTDSTYAIALQAIRVLLDHDPNERNIVAYSILLQCIEDGVVSRFVLRRFDEATSYNFRLSLTIDTTILRHVKDIPMSWKRNLSRRD